MDILRLIYDENNKDPLRLYTHLIISDKGLQFANDDHINQHKYAQNFNDLKEINQALEKYHKMIKNLRKNFILH